MHSPKIAIITPDTLTVIGLKGILQEVMPFMEVSSFASFDELTENHPEQFFHYFVSTNIVINNRNFFIENRRKTIVLTSAEGGAMSNFKCLNTSLPEKQLIKSLLAMEQGAHHNGHNLPSQTIKPHSEILSDREIEVLCLIVQGYINKEIADKLNIGTATVITHRRNIMEKLRAKSVSSLTIYAVTHGYVDINTI